MPAQKTVKRDKQLQEEVKKYTNKGWTVKEAIAFVYGDRMRKDG
jgi:hypothetical protein